ncbi:MAG: SOS response-associated peptidase [Acidobacteria bacterium]|nr:SOS response-associated peptidase [Acidobacteriota bacterium]
MCGRFTQHHTPEEVAGRFEVETVDYLFEPRYNIAPTQPLAAVVLQGNVRRLVAFKWGLVPFWAKDPSIGSRIINAKAETLAEKPSFKHALARRRCLIPADGFYEWQKKGKSPSRPLYIRRRDHALFAFAGLWEEWSAPDGEKLQTCTIITVEPNELIGEVHHRMAAILRPEDEALWLDPQRTRPELEALLGPYPGEELEIYEVSRAVNSPAIDDPSLIEPC